MPTARRPRRRALLPRRSSARSRRAVTGVAMDTAPPSGGLTVKPNPTAAAWLGHLCRLKAGALNLRGCLNAVIRASALGIQTPVCPRNTVGDQRFAATRPDVLVYVTEPLARAVRPGDFKSAINTRRAGHLPARSVGHDMAYKIADIALHVVHEVVKHVAQGQHADQRFVLVQDDQMTDVMLAHQCCGCGHRGVHANR